MASTVNIHGYFKLSPTFINPTYKPQEQTTDGFDGRPRVLSGQTKPSSTPGPAVPSNPRHSCQQESKGLSLCEQAVHAYHDSVLKFAFIFEKKVKTMKEKDPETVAFLIQKLEEFQRQQTVAIQGINQLAAAEATGLPQSTTPPPAPLETGEKLVEAWLAKMPEDTNHMTAAAERRLALETDSPSMPFNSV